MHITLNGLQTAAFFVGSGICLLFSLAFFRYGHKKTGVPIILLVMALAYTQIHSRQAIRKAEKLHTSIITAYQTQHQAFLLHYAILHRLKVIPAYNFEILATCIDRHENSLKFPYGCEYRGSDGKLHGWPEDKARARCISLCKKEYNKWVQQGCPGDFFAMLNHSYAKDTAWHVDIARKYAKATQPIGMQLATR